MSQPVKQSLLVDGVEKFTKQLVSTYGETQLYKTLGELLGYEETPPTIQEFLDGDDYLGETVGASLYPIWRQALYRIYPNPFYSPYSEVILTGAIGIGKTTVGKVGCLYDLLKLVSLNSPQSHFKMVKTDRIAYSIINATLNLAANVLINDLKELMSASKKFSLILNKDKQKGKTTKRSLLPKGIDLVMGSRIGHTLGINIIGAILDEANFQKKVGNQIFDNYNSIKARIQSRFLQPGDSYPARVWLLSSRNMEGDFLDARILEARDDKSVAVFEHPIWDVMKYKTKYCGKTFKVFVGDGNKDPIVLGKNTLSYDESFCMDVPVEYKAQFDRDIYISLRDLAGVSTAVGHRFISSVEAINSCNIIPNPVKQEVVRLDFWDKSEKLLHFMEIDRMLLSQFKLSPRYIHLDMAVNGDRLGIASSFVSELITINKLDSITGLTSHIMEPQFITEFVIPLEAKGGNDIPFYKVKEFMVDLINLGYPLGGVTMDGFQSVNLRQDLNLMGINAEYLSCDRTKDPYFCLKDAIFEKRWLGPKCPILSKELKELIDMGDKIDHPTLGSKDIADAVAGSVYQAKLKHGSYATIMGMAEASGMNLKNDWKPCLE